MRKGTFFLLLLMVGFSPGWGQSVISAGGRSQPTASIAYTVGESFATTLKSSELWLTQGFHQPCIRVIPLENPELGEESQVGTEGGTSPFGNEEILVFPNPVKNRLTIESPFVLGKLEFILRDPLGKEVTRAKTQDNEIRNYLDLTGLAAQTYFLEVRDTKGNLLKSFKVMKTVD